MNDTIKNLIKQKQKQEDELRRIKYEINNTDGCLNEAIFKETELMNEVLKNNLIDIINMIHKRNLKCSSVENAETIWHDTFYRV